MRFCEYSAVIVFVVVVVCKIFWILLTTNVLLQLAQCFKHRVANQSHSLASHHHETTCALNNALMSEWGIPKTFKVDN